MNGSASAQFAAELHRLYQTAGQPPLKQVVRQASRRQPPVRLATSGLSDWLNGRAVPRSADALRFLVGYLGALAQRTGSHAGRTAEQWEALRARAWAEKHSHRGGRPRTRALAATRQDATSQPIGRVIGELDEIDANALEVHPAVTVDGQVAGGQPILPPYLPRMHDQRLLEEVRRAQSGSRIVLVVGGSSTGKTRACWEAIRALPHWRVWHPLVPQRSHALLEALQSGRIASQTVIWLNEAQLYLGAGLVGQKVAAALQELVQQSTGPFLVIGSLWPQYLDALTEPNDHHHAATRHLVEAARVISVPAEFSDTDLAGSRQLIRSDPRLRIAAGYGRRISQFLAGAFALEARYLRGDEVAQAVLWAAMDAYRLGQIRVLTEAFLHDAALSYLHPDAAELAGPDWFGAAMKYLTRPCHGVAGPLARLKGSDDPQDGAVAYRLADYLDQLGRRSRSGVFPPTGFWDAVSVHINDPADLATFADAARRRGRARRAFELFRQAASGGHVDAWIELSWMCWVDDNRVGAIAAADAAAELGDTSGLRDLSDELSSGGDRTGAQELSRRAASHGDHRALWSLARLQEQAGDTADAMRLYREIADSGNRNGLSELARLRELQGDHAGAEAAATEAADLGYFHPLDELAQQRHEAGNHAGAEACALLGVARGSLHVLMNLAVYRRIDDREEAQRLYRLAADHGSTHALEMLAELRDAAGDPRGAEAAAQEAADRGHIKALTRLAERRPITTANQAGVKRLYRLAADLGEVSALRSLAWSRQFAGDHRGAEDLFRQAADHGDADSMQALAELRERAGDRTDAEQLAHQAADHGNRYALSRLAAMREKAGDLADAERIYRQLAADGGIDELAQLACMLDRSGNRAGAEDVARRALDRGDTTPWQILALPWQMLAKQRQRAGDDDAADSAAAEAGYGIDTVEALATMRQEAGDIVGAERIYQRAADAGVTKALVHLADLRAQAGDHARADRLLQQAANAGNDEEMWNLVRFRDQAGDHAGKEVAVRQAIDRGVIGALNTYVQLRRQVGDHTAANRLEQYGLTDDGRPASPWSTA